MEDKLIELLQGTLGHTASGSRSWRPAMRPASRLSIAAKPRLQDLSDGVRRPVVATVDAMSVQSHCLPDLFVRRARIAEVALLDVVTNDLSRRFIAVFHVVLPDPAGLTVDLGGGGNAVRGFP